MYINYLIVRNIKLKTHSTMLPLNLCLLYFINIIIGITTSETLPVLPLLINSKSLSQFTNGAIISLFSFSMLLFIPLTPKISQHFGAQITMIFSITAMALSTFLNALCEFNNNIYIFIVVCSISRICHGIGVAICSTLLCALAAGEKNEKYNIEWIIGNVELTSNIGELFGPIISSFLLKFNLFCIPLFACSILNVFALIAAFFIKYKNEEIETQSENKKLKVNEIVHRLNGKIILPLVCIITDMISSNFFQPSMQIHYKEKFGIGEDISGYFFMIPIAAFILTIPIFIKIIKNRNYFITMIVGILLNALFVLFISPIKLIPQHIAYGLIGLMMIGITSSLMTVPQFVPVLQSLKEDYQIEEKKANDYGSVLLNLSIRVGDGIGPLLGGMINNIYNFDITCVIMCFMNVLTAGIFCIYVAMKKTKEDDSRNIKDNKPMIELSSKIKENNSHNETQNTFDVEDYMERNKELLK